LPQAGNLLTSRGPQDLVPFVQALLTLCAEDAPVLPDAAGREPPRSDPQRAEPPALVVGAMRWLPRPSVRALALGALAVGLMRQRARRAA
jgi:protease I